MPSDTDQDFRFALVDVFTDDVFFGNPLPVVTNADNLTTEAMQRIAREFNQSETTFVLKPSRISASRRLRAFTNLGAEIFGAGHHTLGAWWWLAESGDLSLYDGRNIFLQEAGDSLLQVEIAVEKGRPVMISMGQDTPHFGPEFSDRPRLAQALGLDLYEVAVDIPAKVVSTGAAHLMVALVNRQAIDRCRPDAVHLAAIVDPLRAEGCYVFSYNPCADGTLAYARFFNPAGGIIWEDPASGGAAAPLVCHLVAENRASKDTAFFVEQGTAMGRPSLIEVRVSNAAVTVSGRCATVAEGSIRI